MYRSDKLEAVTSGSSTRTFRVKRSIVISALDFSHERLKFLNSQQHLIVTFTCTECQFLTLLLPLESYFDINISSNDQAWSWWFGALLCFQSKLWCNVELKRLQFLIYITALNDNYYSRNYKLSHSWKLASIFCPEASSKIRRLVWRSWKSNVQFSTINTFQRSKSLECLNLFACFRAQN